MTDQALIIDALIRNVKASIKPEGRLWAPLKIEVMSETRCTNEEMHEAILSALDGGVLVEEKIGWISLPREVDEDQVREAREKRDEDQERRHDMNRQHAAEGQ